jgi:Site-specific recombinases, DNA invertase Pin homologs
METGIYVRVSTEEQAQEGFSIRAQEQKLKDFARIKDWQIYKIYADEGISGKNITGRPAMTELVEDVRARRVKNVLVFKIDRLTRSTADLIYLVDLFNSHDCEFNSLMESIDTQTASGRMFLKIIGIFAEFERENIIERTKLGAERKVKEGYSLCTATASFGYEREKGEKIQEVNDEEATVVKEIFEGYVNRGLTLTDIARRLNVRGVKTKGGVNWSSNKVRRVLTNNNYVGEVRHHVWDEKKRANYEGLHESIISEELFEAAAKILSNNKAIVPRRPPNDENYFAGFLVCARCGYKLKTYNTRKKNKDGSYTYFSGYVCGNKTLRTCDAPSMSDKKMAAAFEEYIAQIADFDAPDDKLLSGKTQQDENSAELARTYEAKLRALEQKEKETLGLYVSDALTFEEYRDMRKLIESDMIVAQTEIERLTAVREEPAVKREDIILNLRDNWKLLSNPERRLFLRDFVVKIVVDCVKPKGQFQGEVRIADVVFR